MGIDTFPEIESFQKLPRQVIVKGGSSSFNEADGAKLRGIVINNIGQTIRDIRVHVVIFDKNKLPALSSSTLAEPEVLPQGGIGAFTFAIKDHHREIFDYHVFASWRFDDRE